MARIATSILLSREERILLKTVAAMYDLTFSAYVRTVIVEHANRVLRKRDNLPRIERIVIDEQTRKGD